jgi:tetratricopeptide (TPR) repeat protein
LIQRAYEKAVSETSSGQRIADFTADLMVQASQDQQALAAANANWRKQFSVWLEDLLERKLESVRTLTAYSIFVDERQEKLRALERSVEVAPNDGGAAVRLGVEYQSVGLAQKAQDQFRRAKKLFSGDSDREKEYRKLIDSYIEQAERSKQTAPSHH